MLVGKRLFYRMVAGHLVAAPPSLGSIDLGDNIAIPIQGHDLITTVSHRLLLGVRRRKFGCRMRLVTPSRLDGTGGASSGLHAQFGQQPLRQNDVTDDE